MAYRKLGRLRCSLLMAQIENKKIIYTNIVAKHQKQMKRIAVYGAGGLGREVACLINKINRANPTWDFLGFYDDGFERGHETDMGKILGNMDDLNSVAESLSIIIAIGNQSVLKSITQKIINPAIDFPNLIDPDTEFLNQDLVRIGKGNIVCQRCLISLNVTIGDFNIINNNTTIAHDVSIGDFNVFMPSVRISGNVTIGNGNLFGVQGTVLQGIKIGNDVQLGSMSLLTRKASDGNHYFGVPARKM